MGLGPRQAISSPCATGSPRSLASDGGQPDIGKESPMATVSDDEVLLLWRALSAFRSGADRRAARRGANVRWLTDLPAGGAPTTGCSASRRPSRRPSAAEPRGHAAGCSTCSDQRPGGSAANMLAGDGAPLNADVHG